ncbi:MAG: hypothetical protein EDR02_01840 [Actinobacteria bacterium]|nr:MAG: hypothetical protein EDR02_01840 [Actinomycetota bacterium]
MSARSGNGTDPHEHQPEPDDGLRLRPMPARCEFSFPLTHPYFEIVYAPLVGPTAVLLGRAMARHLGIAGGPTTVCPVELALEVGIRASSADPLGKRSSLIHAIDRLAHDRIVSRIDDRVLGVHVAVPPLSARALEKLPAVARDAHNGFVALAADDGYRSRSRAGGRHS